MLLRFIRCAVEHNDVRGILSPSNFSVSVDFIIAKEGKIEMSKIMKYYFALSPLTK